MRRMSEGFSLDINEELAGKMNPQAVAALVKSLAIPHAKSMVQTLVQIAENPRMHPAARVAAAKEVLDRGFGKAEQPIPIQLPPGTGKTGVMLLPQAEGNEQWLSQASAHHQKMLEGMK